MTSGDNLAIVLEMWHAWRHGRVESLAPLLDEEMMWQGLRPELVCRNRQQALDVLRRALPHRMTRIDAAEVGNQVVVYAEGPDFHPGGELGPEGQICLVFTLSEGHIVSMRSVAGREEAWTTAGAASP
jgi:hypothetical protein